MILVALSCTEKDFLLNSDRLLISFQNFCSVFKDDVFFLIICQTKSIKSIDANNTFLSELPKNNYLLLQVDYLSVSRSRNKAIEYARDNNFKRLLFHDASLVYTRPFLKWLKKTPSNQIVSANWLFSDALVNASVENNSESSDKITFNDFNDLFVWSYVFPVNIDLPKFDERFGPGECNVFNSGEDFLFLRQFFQKHPDARCFTRFLGTGVIHPSRPKDFSKHLDYACGQGKIHQIYLLEEKSVYAIWRCLLFFGNACLRVLLFKKNSIKILKLRIKGFLDTSVKCKLTCF
jgi:hypothetical protein